jgi:membrane-bound lytic murein transglycosylase B
MQRLWRRAALSAAQRQFSAVAAAPSAFSDAPRPPRVEAALVVRNLSKEATAEDVRAAFALASDVRNVRLPLDADTQSKPAPPQPRRQSLGIRGP